MPWQEVSNDTQDAHHLWHYLQRWKALEAHVCRGRWLVVASNWISCECSSGLVVQQMYFKTEAAPQRLKCSRHWPLAHTDSTIAAKGVAEAQVQVKEELLNARCYSARKHPLQARSPRCHAHLLAPQPCSRLQSPGLSFHLRLGFQLPSLNPWAAKLGASCWPYLCFVGSLLAYFIILRSWPHACPYHFPCPCS